MENRRRNHYRLKKANKKHKVMNKNLINSVDSKKSKKKPITAKKHNLKNVKVKVSNWLIKKLNQIKKGGRSLKNSVFSFGKKLFASTKSLFDKVKYFFTHFNDWLYEKENAFYDKMRKRKK